MKERPMTDEQAFALLAPFVEWLVGRAERSEGDYRALVYAIALAAEALGERASNERDYH